MNCREVKKYLDAYIDGELEAGLIIEVEKHFDTCESCDAVVFAKRRLKEALAQIGRTSAPPDLRQRIEKRFQRRRLGRIAALASALPLAAAATFLFIFRGPLTATAEEPFADVVADVVEHHARELPMEIEGPDPSRAVSWFGGKIDFPVRAPELNLKRASFEGARLSHVRAHQAAQMTYNIDGHRVSLMIFNPRSTVISGGRTVRAGDRQVLLGRRNGFNVAIFLDGDMAYALSSDLSEQQLLDLVAKFKR